MARRLSGMWTLTALVMAAGLGYHFGGRRAAPPPAAPAAPPPTPQTVVKGREFWVEAAMEDHKEFKRGHWLSLILPIGDPQSRDCKTLRMKDAGVLYAKLAPSKDSVALPSGPVKLWAADTCAKTAGPNGLWLRGDLMPSKWSFRASLNFGVERYFVAETPLFPLSKKTRLAARVSLDPSGRLQLLELTPLR